LFAVRRPMLAEYIRPIYMERGILPWDDGNLAPAPATNVRITER
jgi:hypothetical protein